MKKNVQDMIEGKTLKKWAWAVEEVSILSVVEDSNLHLLSMVDLVGVAFPVVAFPVVALSTISDFSKKHWFLVLSLTFLW